jgi:glyoxylase-like metal-dependent hydrolase (beta-lactamase superfamily II)
MRLIGPVYLIGGQDFNAVHLDWPANDANVYLVDSGDTFVMIDCGCGESLPGILENVRRMDFEVGDISHLLLTHAHFPHAAAADDVQKMPVEVMASRAAAAAVAAGDLRTASFCYAHQFPACEEQPTVLEDEEVLEVGAIELKAVALPGHSPGSMGYELVVGGVRMLFCGDTVRSPALRARRDRFGYDRQANLASLAGLLEDAPDVLYPGHGPFCLSHGDVWIQEELRKELERDRESTDTSIPELNEE